VLAEVAYGSVGDRSFGDLDLLVAADDVASACDLLERRGYERINFADVPVETLVDGTPFRWGKEFRFVDPDGDSRLNSDSASSAAVGLMRKYSRISGNGEHRALLPDELFQRFHRKTARCCCLSTEPNTAGDSSRGCTTSH